MLQHVVRSTVIDAPIDRVWAVLRDFNSHDRWHDVVAESRIEGVVTHSKLGASSIDGSNVAAESLSLSDIVGANKSGAISFSRAANSCGTLTLSVSGAQVGQVVLFSFTGSTAIPTTVAFGGVRVTAANTVELKACNVGASAVSVSNLGIRVVTFG